MRKTAESWKRMALNYSIWSEVPFDTAQRGQDSICHPAKWCLCVKCPEKHPTASVALTPVSHSVTSCALCVPAGAPWCWNPEVKPGCLGCCECPHAVAVGLGCATHAPVPRGRNCPTAAFANAGVLHLCLVCFNTVSVVGISVFQKPSEFPVVKGLFLVSTPGFPEWLWGYLV